MLNGTPLKKLKKARKSKPIPGILKFVGKVIIPARSTLFIPKDVFVVNVKPGPHVKISFVDFTFRKWFGEKSEEPTVETTLCYHDFTRLAAFAPAMKKIREGGVLNKTTPAELFSMMEKQPDGPESDAGPLLTNGRSKLFEMDDVSGISRSVRVRWAVRGWRVSAFLMTDPFGWHLVRRVFSHDSH